MIQKVSVADVDAILPQTQCGQCGYKGCLPYAEALVNNNEKINRCPPGGVKGLLLLGKLLNQDPTPYIEEIKAKETPPQVAIIDENACIGCMKCIQACPVDAIVGTSKRMHTVIEDECSGCGLCVAPCPVDCIDMVELTLRNNRSPEPVTGNFPRGRPSLASDLLPSLVATPLEKHPITSSCSLLPIETKSDQYRRRYYARQERLKKKELKKEKKFLAAKKATEIFSSEKRKAEIAAAIARSKSKK